MAEVRQHYELKQEYADGEYAIAHFFEQAGRSFLKGDHLWQASCLLADFLVLWTYIRIVAFPRWLVVCGVVAALPGVAFHLLPASEVWKWAEWSDLVFTPAILLAGWMNMRRHECDFLVTVAIHLLALGVSFLPHLLNLTVPHGAGAVRSGTNAVLAFFMLTMCNCAPSQGEQVSTLAFLLTTQICMFNRSPRLLRLTRRALNPQLITHLRLKTRLLDLEK